MDSQSAAKLPFNLKIIPINDTGFPIGIPFLAMFNPEQIAIKEDLSWTSKCAPGSFGSTMSFDRIGPRSFSLDLTIDGTGVNTNGVKIPVTLQVALFRAATTAIQGLIHQPAFLLVQYGLFISTCVMNTSTVTYTMFDFTGLPIRAKINATFTEHTIQTLSNILAMFSSPDLTHERTVKEGDLLPLMTFNIYNKQDYYLQVAKANRIKNFRALKQGTKIFFPPIGNNK